MKQEIQQQRQLVDLLHEKIDRIQGEIPSPSFSPDGKQVYCHTCGQGWKAGTKPSCRPCGQKWQEIDQLKKDLANASAKLSALQSEHRLRQFRQGFQTANEARAQNNLPQVTNPCGEIRLDLDAPISTDNQAPTQYAYTKVWDEEKGRYVVGDVIDTSFLPGKCEAHGLEDCELCKTLERDVYPEDEVDISQELG